jgi:hypothetical protein
VTASGSHKDLYLVTEYGEKLGLGSHDYELVDVMPLEFPERSTLTYIAA